MRLGAVIAGATVVIAGIILLIIAGNEISAINACPEFYSTYTCAPFLGASSKQPSLAIANSLLEIGVLMMAVGAIILLLGRTMKSSPAVH